MFVVLTKALQCPQIFEVLAMDLKPEYLIVCFDRKAPTFRKQMYVGYQAKRPTMSDDLVPQIDIVHKTLDSAKIKHFGIDGFEADDLIGTISKQAVKQNLEVIILSGDRDLLQLVNSHVLMLSPIVGITNMALFDETKVKEKYGLTPIQIIDYKALVGDNSDNYPGVTGIGPKTASDLLKKYDNLENLYSHIGELPLQLQEKLATDAEQAAFNIPYARGIMAAPVKYSEIEHMLEQVKHEMNIQKSDIVEIISGPFKRENAKVTRIDKAKEEVVVELLEAAVPIPITVKMDAVKVVRRDTDSPLPARDDDSGEDTL